MGIVSNILNKKKELVSKPTSPSNFVAPEPPKKKKTLVGQILAKEGKIAGKVVKSIFPVASRINETVVQPFIKKTGLDVVTQNIAPGVKQLATEAYQKGKENLLNPTGPLIGDRTAGIRRFLKEAGQATARSAYQFGRLALEKAGMPTEVAVAPTKGSEKVSKFLYGEEGPGTVEGSVAKTEETLGTLGATPYGQKILSPVLVAGSLALDLYPGGKAEKSAIEKILKEGAEEGYHNIAKREIKDISEEALARLEREVPLAYNEESKKAVIKDILKSDFDRAALESKGAPKSVKSILKTEPRQGGLGLPDQMTPEAEAALKANKQRLIDEGSIKVPENPRIEHLKSNIQDSQETIKGLEKQLEVAPRKERKYLNERITTEKKGVELFEKELAGIETPALKEFPKVKAVDNALERAKAGEDFGPRVEGKLPKEKPIQESILPEQNLSPDEIARADEELTAVATRNEQKLAEDVKSVREVGRSKAEIKNDIENQKLEASFGEEALKENPARKLGKYSNKRTGEIPEVTGKPTSKFAKFGDEIADELGYADSEAAREAYQDYIKRRESAKVKKDFIRSQVRDYQDKKQVIEAVQKQLRMEGRSRAKQMNLIQEYFNLTDGELKTIMKGNPDLRLISEDKFNNLLKEVEGRAFDVFKHNEAILDLEGTIFEKELKKVDNLRQAMKLPPIENMTIEQLNKFNELLDTFKHGDEFLGVRQLETIKNTDLSGIKTKREALEDLSKKTGASIDELKQIKVKELDRYTYDTALARQNPLFSKMVEDTNYATVTGSLRYFETKKAVNELVRKARASRKRSFLDKIIPSDQMVFDYLENTGHSRDEFAKRMTTEELKLAEYIQNKYAAVRDYLVEQGTLKAFRADYITHIRRSFLEAWRESGKFRGFKNAMKEMFDAYKQDEAVFNILDQKTGEVLPLEKFFKYSMRRTGEVAPTKNVAKAFLTYMETYEKKRALDALIPKIDIYAHALTPAKMTPRGLEYDDSLKRFVKEWLNTKKGRVTSDALVKPGGKVDWAMRSGIALTRLLDLGLNIPVGLASHLGEQVTSFVNLGTKKYAKGLRRMFSKSGKEIARKYDALVGERFVDMLRDSSKDIGDKFAEGFYSLFSSASRKGNMVHILGSMTPEEFASKTISPERLAVIRKEIGKYRSLTGDESIIGKTAIGKGFTQYKSWAVPILSQTSHNIKTLIKMASKKENPFKSQEFAELLRATIMTGALGVSTYGYYAHLRDDKDRNFLENLAFKSMNDAMTLLGGLDPKTWVAVPRLISFLNDFGTSVSNIVASLATGSRTEEGDVKGLKKLEQTVTPRAVKQISIPKETDHLDALLSEQSSTSKAIQDEAETKWTELKELAKTDKAAANEMFTKLESENPKLADAVYETGQDDKKGLTDMERKIKRLGVENGNRARYIYLELQNLETKEEKNAYITNLDDKGVISDNVYDQLKTMIKEGQPSFKTTDKPTERNIIGTVAIYAKALGADPITAFRRIFKGEKILRTDNGTIIVERMPLSESTKVKMERGATEEMYLDHTLPLELGGDNSEDNLKLVPKEVWASYTPIENYIAKKLKAGELSKKEAQKLIIQFKNGEITKEEIMQ